MDWSEKEGGEEEGEFPLPFGNPFLRYALEQLDYYNLFRFTHKIPLFLIKTLEILWYSLEMALLPNILSNDIRGNVEHLMGSRVRKKYGEKRAPQIIKSLTIANMRYLARYLIESLFVYPAMLHVKDFYKKYVSLKVLDEKIYKHALKRGAVVLSAHLDFFLLYTYFGMTNHYAVNVMDLEGMGAFVPYIRRAGCILVPNPRGDKSARDLKIRDMLEYHIKQKAILCLLSDAGYPYYPLVPFFGEYCRTPAGAAMLSLFYNKKMAMIWVETDPKRKHHTIVVGREIKLHQDFSLKRRDLVFQNTIYLNKILENHIRKHITRWAFLPVYHTNKSFQKVTEFTGTNTLKSIIERLEFHHGFIKMSYEPNRDDKGYLQLLEKSIKELQEL